MRRYFRLETIGVSVIAAVIVWFYGYLATSHVADPFEFPKAPADYYHYLVEGFVAGKLSMVIDPAPELATLADPYEPLERVRIGHPGLADASYYQGKYYLYFGVAPAVTLFLPFRLLTGLHFSEALACALFCAGGYLVSVALFLNLRRRYFPACPTAAVWLGVLMLGLGNFCVVMLTRAQFYEVPISSAYFFSCFGLWALFQSLHADLRSRRWLVLASVGFGLAIASRPHFVFAALVLVVAAAWRWRAQMQPKAGVLRRTLLGDALALFLPVGTIVVGLLIYNYLRFDSPFDFGQRYQLGGSNQPKMTLMTWESIPANLYYYFWAPAQFSRYFPFVQGVEIYPGTLPKSYYGIEDPFGLLTNMPCFWLAFLAPVIWWLRHRPQRELGWLMLILGGCFATVCSFTLVFVSATNRYMVDFLPALLLLAAIGLLMLADAPRNPQRSRRIGVWVALGAVVIYTAFFNVMAAFQHNGLFRHHQPEVYDRIGRQMNRPAAWWEKFSGSRYGPVELTVKLSRKSLGSTEPLIVTGKAKQSDFLYLYYTDRDSVQIGFTHMGGGSDALLSAPIPLDYDVPHRIGVQMGSLYPPRAHPSFAGVAASEIDAAKRTLLVTLDGVPYVNTKQSFHDSLPEWVSFGRNNVSDYAGREFKGELLEVRRQSPTPFVEPFGGGGFVQLALRLPEGRAGQREPLIATGAVGTGDLVFIAYEDDSHVRLGFHHAGSETILSDPLTVQSGQIQRLEVSLGSFYPAPKNSTEVEASKALIVKWNDRTIWAEAAAFHPASAIAPAIARNSWQSEAIAPAFTGEIVAVQPRDPPSLARPTLPFVFPTYWVENVAPAYGPLRLKVDLPRDRAGQFEPLLVTGPSVSQADYVWIQYNDAGRVTLGYEHTGGGGPRELIPVDFNQPHVIELELPSLYPPAGDAYFSGRSFLDVATAKIRARIKVDGVVRIDSRVKAFESVPSDATIGENRVSTTFGQRFTGRILQSERGISAPPSGFLEQNGPLEIALTWPQPLPIGAKEVLLATGTAERSDALTVSYVDAEHVIFLVRDHTGKQLASTPLPVKAATRQTLRIGWSGFRVAGPDEVNAARSALPFRLSVDGARTLDAQADFVVANPQTVWIGRGPVGNAFTGTIATVRRLTAEQP